MKISADNIYIINEIRDNKTTVKNKSEWDIKERKKKKNKKKKGDTWNIFLISH